MVESYICDAEVAFLLSLLYKSRKNIETAKRQTKIWAKQMIEQFITLDIINLCAAICDFDRSATWSV